MTPPSDDLFARARRVAIADVAGVTLYRAGRRLRGECPVCGSSKGKKADGAFSVDPDAGIYYCFAGCQAGGDVIDLAAAIRKTSRREAAEWLVGAEFKPAPRTESPRTTSPVAEASPSNIAAQLWAGSRGAHGTLVVNYLVSRGIAGPVLDAAISVLRCHPNAFWGFDEEGDPQRPIRAPAMVARPVTPDGPAGGVHLTYLRGDGRGKASLSPAKRMFGRQTDAAGRAAGVWLAGPRGKGPLIVAEGIESALSAAMLTGWPCRIVAALALNRLQGGILKDRFGRIDPDCLAADPERPAFTWPLDGLKVEAVILAVDRDMKPVTVKARRPSGGTVERVLRADDRARICAGLAAQAWRRANPDFPAHAVRVIAPAAGRDFNDELRETAG